MTTTRRKACRLCKRGLFHCDQLDQYGRCHGCRVKFGDEKAAFAKPDMKAAEKALKKAEKKETLFSAEAYRKAYKVYEEKVADATAELLAVALVDYMPEIMRLTDENGLPLVRFPGKAKKGKKK